MLPGDHDDHRFRAGRACPHGALRHHLDISGHIQVPQANDDNCEDRKSVVMLSGVSAPPDAVFRWFPEFFSTSIHVEQRGDNSPSGQSASTDNLSSLLAHKDFLRRIGASKALPRL